MLSLERNHVLRDFLYREDVFGRSIYIMKVSTLIAVLYGLNTLPIAIEAVGGLLSPRANCPHQNTCDGILKSQSSNQLDGYRLNTFAFECCGRGSKHPMK